MATHTIRCGEAFSIDFHPSRQLLATALITGQIQVYDCAGARPLRFGTARPHKGACRTVRFTPGGESIFSGGSDRSLQQRDVIANEAVWKQRCAHKSAINVLIPVGEHGVASGDDDGRVQVWDVRQQASVLQFEEHADFLSDLLYREHDHSLACTSGDGYLSVLDLRRGRLEARARCRCVRAPRESRFMRSRRRAATTRRTSCSASRR
jgi:WD40 repeat protein